MALRPTSGSWPTRSPAAPPECSGSAPARCRRAYDRGWSADDVHRWLTRHSATAVPQPLTYLVDDAARRHGSIRIGPAASVLRVDHAPRRRPAEPSPGEASSGCVRLRRPCWSLRSRSRSWWPCSAMSDTRRSSRMPPGGCSARPTGCARPPRLPWPRPRTPPRADRLAAALQKADRAASQRAEQLGGLATEVTLDRLRSATRHAQPVRVGYVTADGRAVERELSPLDLAAGAVRGVDRESAQVVTIPLARISAVIPMPSANGASG